MTVEIRALARQYTVEALTTLVALMRGLQVPPSARVAAANIILDRGHGRAPQAVTGEGGGPVQVATTVIHEHLSVAR